MCFLSEKYAWLKVLYRSEYTRALGNIAQLKIDLPPFEQLADSAQRSMSDMDDEIAGIWSNVGTKCLLSNRE